jgi:hypothetical protein
MFIFRSLHVLSIPSLGTFIFNYLSVSLYAIKEHFYTLCHIFALLGAMSPIWWKKDFSRTGLRMIGPQARRLDQLLFRTATDRPGTLNLD